MANVTDPKGTAGDFKAVIYNLLEVIDQRLAARESALFKRPFEAASVIVKDFIIAVSDDTEKDDFAEKPWFAILFHHVREWYHERYGDALERGADNKARGIVLVRDIPVELTVPLTRSHVETLGQTAWLCFPVTVEDDEEPLDWLKNSPALALLNDTDRAKIRKDAAEVATALRTIQINFMGIEPTDTVVSGLLGGVRAEFESAAGQMLRAEASGRASALWTLHMAIERILKAFAQYKTGTFRQIHNLFELFDGVVAHGIKVDRELLKKLPREGDVINDRYGLRGTPSVWETYEAYKSSLAIVAGVSQSFRWKINFGGSRILLRKAPWITLPS